MTDTAGAQILGLWREAEEGIDLALDEELQRLDGRIGLVTQWMSLARVEPDMGRHHDQEGTCGFGPPDLHADVLALQVAMLRMPSFANSS